MLYFQEKEAVMKNNKALVLLVVGVVASMNAYRVDSTYDAKKAEAKMDLEQKKLEAKTTKQSAKIKADTQYKRTKIEADRQKDLAGIKYKEKVNAAEIQADREKARAEGVNVYGNNWRDNVEKADNALATSNMSWFK
jgi:hypothetical protein